MKYAKECDQIADYIASGLTFTKACEFVGIARSTVRPHYNKWLDVQMQDQSSRDRLLGKYQEFKSGIGRVDHTAPIPYISTKSDISFVWNDEIVSVNNSQLTKIKEALDNGDGELALSLSSLKNSILSHRYNGVEIEDGVLTYNGSKMDGNLVSRILRDMEAGNTDFDRYVKFLANMMNNPSNKMRRRVYDFIESQSIEISDDGHILAFKVVRSDYKDKHSGTFDNSPGKILEMKRADVDDDDSVTCSTGLHVCSSLYVKVFSNKGDVVVLCKVNPADVVSIPTDYNDSKMRTCKYEVLQKVYTVE
jgi:hypothetical protein